MAEQAKPSSSIVFDGKTKTYSGQVHYLDQKKQWIPSTLTLSLTGHLTYTTPFFGIGKLTFNKTHEVQLTPAMTFTTRGHRVITIQFDPEAASKSDFFRFSALNEVDGDLFFTLMRDCVARLLAERSHHVHPLSTPTPLQFMEKHFICNVCSNRRYGPAMCCEFCEKYWLCMACSQCVNSHAALAPMNGPYRRSRVHEHVLKYLDESVDPLWFVPPCLSQGYTCNTCNKPFAAKSAVYCCVQCPDYNECSDCMAHAATPVTAQSALHNEVLALNVLHLDKVLTRDKSQRYQFNGKPCPLNMSVVTSQCWHVTDIEKRPADNAYFEVKFHSFDSNSGRIGVGIGNQLFQQQQLLGHQQNSYALFNYGKVAHNSIESERDLSISNCGFKPGDTVGAGILFDSFRRRQLYFTRNGKLLGTHFQEVHKGMDCFPGVTFSKYSKVSFSVNFTGPFLFDQSTLVNYRADAKSYIADMPQELISLIISHATGSKSALDCYRQVSRTWAKAGADNVVWRRLFLVRWPHQNPNLNIKSWKQFYSARLQAVVNARGLRKTEAAPIENCEFVFKCPMNWGQLEPVKEKERFCNKCEKSVYQVEDQKTLNQFVNMGRCVTFVPFARTFDDQLDELIAEMNNIGGMLQPIDDIDDFDDIVS